MKNETIITVKLQKNPYNIYVGLGITNKISSNLEKLNVGNFAIILTSPTVYKLYREIILKIFKHCDYRIMQIPDGEEAKSKEWLFRILNFLLKHDKPHRQLYLVCFGGGTVGDVGGFSASIYKRGISYIQIPTTLLSQIDASIGGKTAINLKLAKNIIGTFYQPKAVFLDPIFLETLNTRQIKEGLAEAIKYAIIKNRHLFEFLKKNKEKILKLNPKYILYLITECVKIKAKIVELDEKETKGLRTILNFGHTFAHALEASLGYKKITHGEAVAVGMVFEAKLSYVLGECSLETVQEIVNLLKIYELPIKVSFNLKKLLKSFFYDKKFIKNVRMVIVQEIGKVKVKEKIQPQIIKKMLKDFSKL